MHSVKVEAHRRYASISPKAELKVHVFLNVGHQQGCKVVTLGTSVKINVFFFHTHTHTHFPLLEQKRSPHVLKLKQEREHAGGTEAQRI